MARTEARVFTSLWTRDRDFRQLPMMARFFYTFLIEQEDLTHCGVIPLREARWADLLDEPAEAEVRGWVETLERARFVVTDRRAGELLVRSLVRRDKVLRQPFLFPALADSAESVQSPAIRGVLADELCRIRAGGDVNERIAADLDTLIKSLSETDPDTHPDRHPDTQSEAHPETHPERQPERQPGEGESNGRSIGGSPIPNPHPPTPGAKPSSATPLWPASVPDPDEGEGEGSGKPTPDQLAELITEVRKLKPGWASRSIRRAMTEPSVVERGWTLARAAMLIVAADRDSQAPGRLSHDGKWWSEADAQVRPPPEPEKERGPCATCMGIRRITDEDGKDVGKCPDCHPAIARPA
jgi:hypothetical protein